ncbi:RraA family protein [Muricauda sp. 2012CJ35-5]|uniref:RraA family protein n=1 Tax=Flagellimonas spongiicola TaxID=2942208 RepID=A0ABT0PUZ6_9FLAO|nr:RraA family protein [Allomuricauda spongiicola]MCL6275101.1 RraA family protein [Allomuricauda spongiicola]
MKKQTYSMMIWRGRVLFTGLFLFLLNIGLAQTMTKEQMLFLTPQWTGERFEDGRPKVADDVLERMKQVTIEEAWGVLRNEGYHNQFESGWQPLHDDVPIVGRALTVQYMPNRPDVSDQIKSKGKSDGRIGNTNSWPIDMLVEGDVYVADAFGKIVNGTLIGDNLGNSIYAKSKNGVVFNASSRDMEGLSEIQGFNAFVRGWDPSFLTEVMLLSINSPIRIGAATVLPGDIVLAKREGIMFIPAHLAEKVVVTSEVVRLRDLFAITRLKEGKYTPGQIDNKWTEEIEKDFSDWLRSHIDELPVPKEQVRELLKKRMW